MIKITNKDLIMNLIQIIDDYKDVYYNTEEEITTFINGMLVSLCYTLNHKTVVQIYNAISEHMKLKFNIELDIIF